MNHGFKNDYLCAASRIEAYFKDDIGSEKAVSGTAFFVKSEEGSTNLITNRHVIDLDYKQRTAKYKNFKLVKLIVYNKEKDPQTGLPTDDNELLIGNIDQFIYSDNYMNDVACLKNVQAASLNGKEPKASFSINLKDIADQTRLMEKITVCDFVAFPGFPDWYDKKNNLPILRTGTIASDPRFDYSYSGEDEGQVIAYEAFSFGGSSGSPVFAIQKGIKVEAPLFGGGFREIMLVGINAGHIPVKDSVNSHSGISFFYKSSIIFELLK
ncbi:trypsin-like peptidase domain-containing protein [Flavobacterium suncheonense]|uniref:Serine protease n=1 Tax=Flavobacterium suncheonense GH29-5 = DSM 17707 TaxID=1121899 RepID=A0A0A2MG39_9FLAO|nr:trypsin-like peptidase domain-containing protein [Flavobacterium suncheonense]KGO90566.1 hypothetical protein Q764_00130 [Flavobacterium suncheonense GH29-5 = DSM 17707]